MLQESLKNIHSTWPYDTSVVHMLEQKTEKLVLENTSEETDSIITETSIVKHWPRQYLGNNRLLSNSRDSLHLEIKYQSYSFFFNRKLHYYNTHINMPSILAILSSFDGLLISFIQRHISPTDVMTNSYSFKLNSNIFCSTAVFWSNL